MFTSGQIVWIPTGEPNEWREWQYSPRFACYHFVGLVENERVQYALSRMANGVNPNA